MAPSTGSLFVAKRRLSLLSLFLCSSSAFRRPDRAAGNTASFLSSLSSTRSRSLLPPSPSPPSSVADHRRRCCRHLLLHWCFLSLLPSPESVAVAIFSDPRGSLSPGADAGLFSFRSGHQDPAPSPSTAVAASSAHGFSLPSHRCRLLLSPFLHRWPRYNRTSWPDRCDLAGVLGADAMAAFLFRSMILPSSSVAAGSPPFSSTTMPSSTASSSLLPGPTATTVEFCGHLQTLSSSSLFPFSPPTSVIFAAASPSSLTVAVSSSSLPPAISPISSSVLIPRPPAAASFVPNLTVIPFL